MSQSTIRLRVQFYLYHFSWFHTLNNGFSILIARKKPMSIEQHIRGGHHLQVLAVTKMVEYLKASIEYSSTFKQRYQAAHPLMLDMLSKAMLWLWYLAMWLRVRYIIIELLRMWSSCLLNFCRWCCVSDPNLAEPKACHYTFIVELIGHGLGLQYLGEGGFSQTY